MNQLCKVCGEMAAGFHFGAFTCEGCKSFFGRTYNNQRTISKCKNNNKCIITKNNRTTCKACRLNKCLLVGMSKTGSRYGRRSNWFKIHCLLKEQNGVDDSSCIDDLFTINNCNNFLIQIDDLSSKQKPNSPNIKHDFDGIDGRFWPVLDEDCDSRTVVDYSFRNSIGSQEQIEPIDLSMKLKPR